MAGITGYIQRLRYFFDKLKNAWKQKVSNKYKYIRYVIWLRIKRLSFKDREEKMREAADMIRENPNIYFTTHIVKTGFTDQLIGFSFLYKLGKGLGFKYYHTPLSSHRTSDPFLYDPLSDDRSPESNPASGSSNSKNFYNDVFDFLGLNACLEKHSEDISSTPLKKYQINMEATLSKAGNINSYQSLLKVILHPFLSKKRKILLTFKIEPNTYFKYFRYTNPQKDHKIDYRRAFKTMERNEKHVSKFDKDAVKMMVHIRQGDTGTIKTPWNTFIPTWYITEGKFTQFKNRADIPNQKMIEVDEFYTFLNDLFDEMDSTTFSTVLYSDGFKKAFRWIYRFHKSKDISQKEIEKLRELEDVYDDQQLQKFENLSGVKKVIGEEVE